MLVFRLSYKTLHHLSNPAYIIKSKNTNLFCYSGKMPETNNLKRESISWFLTPSRMRGFHAEGKALTVKADNLPQGSHDAKMDCRKGSKLRHASKACYHDLPPPPKPHLPSPVLLPPKCLSIFFLVCLCVHVCEWVTTLAHGGVY